VKLRELAARLECRLDGDGEVDIRRVAPIEAAGPGDITFLSNAKYAKHVASTHASAIILREDGTRAPCPVLRARDPYLAFARAVGVLVPQPPPTPGVHPLAYVAPGATVDPSASIGPFVAIGEQASIGARTVIHAQATVGAGTRVGADCVIHAQVSLRERVTLGDRVVVQDGAVVGSDGFGFVRLGDGSYEKIPQRAAVVIEDDVEVGANTTIDRPAVGETRIKRGAKIDNLVQIAHGVVVGRHTALASQVGVSGSTVIGDRVMLGGQVGVGGHLTLGDGSTAVGQSGVTNSLGEGEHVAGYPAIEQRAWRRSSVIVKHLPELKRRVDALEARLAALDGGAPRPTPSEDE
jgi:UDP-3-O-[3-hydroxymyristoyl] glucosamine N-acyltransferase